MRAFPVALGLVSASAWLSISTQAVARPEASSESAPAQVAAMPVTDPRIPRETRYVPPEELPGEKHPFAEDDEYREELPMCGGTVPYIEPEREPVLLVGAAALVSMAGAGAGRPVGTERGVAVTAGRRVGPVTITGEYAMARFHADNKPGALRSAGQPPDETTHRVAAGVRYAIRVTRSRSPRWGVRLPLTAGIGARRTGWRRGDQLTRRFVTAGAGVVLERRTGRDAYWSIKRPRPTYVGLYAGIRTDITAGRASAAIAAPLCTTPCAQPRSHGGADAALAAMIGVQLRR